MDTDNLLQRRSSLRSLLALFQRTFFLSSLLFVFANSADATMVYGTSAAGELTGSRAVSDPGLMTTNMDDWNDAAVSWVITDNGNRTFHYEYTFTGFNSPNISHFDIDITDNAINDNTLADPDALTGATLNGVPIASSDLEFGDFDGITGAVKFDINDESESISIYAFDSNRLAVYGHLVIKGGLEKLQNTGLNNPSSMDILDFIPRPDGSSLEVPEPNSLVLLALASAAVTVGLRRRS